MIPTAHVIPSPVTTMRRLVERPPILAVFVCRTLLVVIAGQGMLGICGAAEPTGLEQRPPNVIVNKGGYDRGQPPSYFAPYKIPTLPEGPAGEYLTDREAAEAVQFITAHKDGPFFLYLPHYCVHTPIQAKPDVTARYTAKAAPQHKPRNDAYAAMVESVDDSLGRA